jgi:hypothetical protein
VTIDVDDVWATADSMALATFRADAKPMRKPDLTFPELMFVIVTRAFLGAGVALLVSSRLTERQRKTAGRVLLATGAVTTIPAALAVFGRK